MRFTRISFCIFSAVCCVSWEMALERKQHIKAAWLQIVGVSMTYITRIFFMVVAKVCG